VNGATGKVEETVKDTIANIQNAPKEAVSGYVSGLLPKLGGYSGQDFEGAGGFVPSLDQLKQWYSMDAITKGLEDQVKGLVSAENVGNVLSQATGGLSDIFIKNEKGQGLQLQVKFGWDEADKLIDMFTTGGISRTPGKSMKRVVGGAQVQAALGPISWGSKIAWAETIGLAKLTKTPVQVDQTVKGKMNLTVGMKVTRDAGEEIVIKSTAGSKISAGSKASYEATNEMEVNGVDGATLEGSAEVLMKAGASLKLTPGAAVLKCDKLIVEGPKLVLRGKVLNAGKG